MKKSEVFEFPAGFFDDIPITTKEFDDDYVPFDWVHQVKYEESIGEEVDPEIKRILGMEVREEEIPYEE